MLFDTCRKDSEMAIPTSATAPVTKNDWVDLSVGTHNIDPAALLMLSLWMNSGTGLIDQNQKNLLVISPYNQPQHLLDTTTIPKASALLAEALTILKPTRPDYATAAYIDSFNWNEVMAYLRRLISANPHSWRAESFYIVVFRSRSVTTRDGATLGMLDMNAFEEAVKAGGLLRYDSRASDWAHHDDILTDHSLQILVRNGRLGR